MRIVSLVPSVTETLLAWGVEPVAVTRFCEQPHLPAVGGTKNPDVAAIVGLAPDLVVLDTEENRREDHDALVAAGVAVHVTAVRHLDDVVPTLAALAARIGVATPAAESAPVPVPASTPAVSGLRAFVPIWRRPWMSIGVDTYGSSLLAHLGVVNVVAADGPGHDPADRYPTVELEAMAALAPAVALLPSEPYAFTEAHAEEVGAALGCPALLIDGADLFWWGVRTPAALRRLAEAVAGARAAVVEAAP